MELLHIWAALGASNTEDDEGSVLRQARYVFKKKKLDQRPAGKPHPHQQ